MFQLKIIQSNINRHIYYTFTNSTCLVKKYPWEKKMACRIHLRTLSQMTITFFQSLAFLNFSVFLALLLTFYLTSSPSSSSSSNVR